MCFLCDFKALNLTKCDRIKRNSHVCLSVFLAKDNEQKLFTSMGYILYGMLCGSQTEKSGAKYGCCFQMFDITLLENKAKRATTLITIKKIRKRFSGVFSSFFIPPHFLVDSFICFKLTDALYNYFHIRLFQINK